MNLRQALRFLFSKQQRVLLAHQKEKYPDMNLPSDEPYSDEELHKVDLEDVLTQVDINNAMTR